MEKPGLMHIDELVRRAIIGDGTAFTQLWDTNVVSLRRYISSTIHGLDEFFIDDICSRSFEKAFRQIGSFDPTKSQFATWLKVIARNTALDVLDSEGRAQSKFVSFDDGGASLMPEIDNIDDGSVTALDHIIKDEDEEKLLACVEALPELYREVARKRLIEALQYKEIAEELGMELNTVRTRIRRAKALIDNMKSGEDE